MPILDIVNQFIENSNISKAFRLDVNSFLVLISGSFIVGYICLTFYYKVYYDHSNKKWNELNFSEKAIVSLVIGFLSILFSQYVVAIYQLAYINYKNLEQFFLQLNYVFPFLYFISISALTAKKNYQKMEFIKVYIKASSILIFSLNFIFLLIILYINRSWSAILWVVILIIFIIYLIYMKKIIEILIGYAKRFKSSFFTVK